MRNPRSPNHHQCSYKMYFDIGIKAWNKGSATSLMKYNRMGPNKVTRLEWG